MPGPVHAKLRTMVYILMVPTITLSKIVPDLGCKFDVCVLLMKVANDSGDGEDERSIEMHIAAMKQTWKSRSPDAALLTDRMLRTYADRREKVDDGMTLSDLLDLYPALQDETQVLSDFILSDDCCTPVCLFTALHGMQTRSSDENSVRLSVRLSYA